MEVAGQWIMIWLHWTDFTMQLTVSGRRESCQVQMPAQSGVVSVVRRQGDVETSRQQEGACHGQKVQDTGGRGAGKEKEKVRSTIITHAVNPSSLILGHIPTRKFVPAVDLTSEAKGQSLNHIPLSAMLNFAPHCLMRHNDPLGSQGMRHLLVP